jgi:polyisoprenoid-binding protein YceI
MVLQGIIVSIYLHNHCLNIKKTRMNNLNRFFTLAIAASFAVACNNAPTETVETKEAEEVIEVEETEAVYALQTEGDEVMWEGYKIVGSDSHVGTIQVAEGSFQTKGGNIVGGSFVIDMNSIKNNDLPEEGDYNQAKLVGHLMSPDFFAVEEFPTATFTVTSVEAVEGSEAGITHNIMGNLKMRGNEKNITIPAMVSMENDMIMVKTPEFVIDRTEWNVQYGSNTINTSLAKDKAIADNIKLKLNLAAKKS